MRTVVLILLVSCIFIFGSVFTDVFIEREINNIAERVEEIESVDDLKAVIVSWETTADYFEIIIDHGDLEDVSRLLWAMEEEIKYDFDEFMESKALALNVLDHIKERNTIGLINVL